MDEQGHPQFKRYDWPFQKWRSLEELRRMDAELKRFDSPNAFPVGGEFNYSEEGAFGAGTADLYPTPIRGRITGQYTPTSPWYSFTQETFFNDSTTLSSGDWTFTYAGGFDDSTTFNAAELNKNTAVPFGSDTLGNDTGAVVTLWPMEDGQSWGFFFEGSGSTPDTEVWIEVGSFVGDDLWEGQLWSYDPNASPGSKWTALDVMGDVYAALPNGNADARSERPLTDFRYRGLFSGTYTADGKQVYEIIVGSRKHKDEHGNEGQPYVLTYTAADGTTPGDPNLNFVYQPGTSGALGDDTIVLFGNPSPTYTNLTVNNYVEFSNATINFNNVTFINFTPSITFHGARFPYAATKTLTPGANANCTFSLAGGGNYGNAGGAYDPDGTLIAGGAACTIGFAGYYHFTTSTLWNASGTICAIVRIKTTANGGDVISKGVLRTTLGGVPDTDSGATLECSGDYSCAVGDTITVNVVNNDSVISEDLLDAMLHFHLVP